MAQSQLQKVVYQMVDAGELERLNSFLEETTVSCTKWYKFPIILHKNHEGEALIGEIWDRVLKRHLKEADSIDGLSQRSRVYGYRIGRLLMNKAVLIEKENKTSFFFTSGDRTKNAHNFLYNNIFQAFNKPEHFYKVFKSQDYGLVKAHVLQMEQLVKAWGEASPKDREIGNVRVLDPIPDEVIEQMNKPAVKLENYDSPWRLVMTSQGVMSRGTAMGHGLSYSN